MQLCKSEGVLGNVSNIKFTKQNWDERLVPKKYGLGFIIEEMGTRDFDVKKLLNDRKFWFASFLIAWAAALQGHMMWLQRQDSFKQKFKTLDDQKIDDQQDSTEGL